MGPLQVLDFVRGGCYANDGMARALVRSMSTKDIFTKIAERDAASKPSKQKLVKRWVVFVDGRQGHKLYTKAKAAQIARRFNRMHRTDAAYTACFGRVWVVA